MPTPAERRRAKHVAESALITDAAAELRAHGEAEDRFAGLDEDENGAVVALLEVIAGGAAGDIDWRTWEAARRVAVSILAPAPTAGRYSGPGPMYDPHPHPRTTTDAPLNWS